MNRGLLAVLAVVGCAVVYLQAQGSDDELLAKPGGAGGAKGAAGAPHDSGARDSHAPGGRAQPDARADGRVDSRSSSRTDTKAVVPPWAADALVHGAQAWQARGHADEQTQPRAQARVPAREQPSAWSAATPPPAPVLRPPPPTEVVVVAPPAPTAPRFPHAWVGRFNDGAVLSGPDTTWVVRPGDVIEGQWRVDGVDERRMSLTYLPLNLSQQVVMR